ncbi:MAG: hypothetical protein ACLTRS_04080 [Lachnospiraceae bacterium]
MWHYHAAFVFINGTAATPYVFQALCDLLRIGAEKKIRQVYLIDSNYVDCHPVAGTSSVLWNTSIATCI